TDGRSCRARRRPAPDERARRERGRAQGLTRERAGHAGHARAAGPAACGIAPRSRRHLGGGAQAGGLMARVTRPVHERPVEGRAIVITRARAQAQRFAQLLEAAGARVLQAPTIVIEPPASWELLDTALGELESFTWVVFTSVNGVAMVDRRLSARGLAWTAISRKRGAAIGPATAEALAEHGVRVEMVPMEYRAEGLVEGLRRVPGPRDPGL